MEISRFFNTIVLVTTRIGASLLTLLVLMLLSRKLEISIYGEYQKMWLVYNTLLPFFLMGLPSSIGYLVPQISSTIERRNFFFQTILVLAGLGMVLAVLFYLGSTGLLPVEVFKLNRQYLSSFFWIPVFSIPLLAVDLYYISIGKVKHAGAFNLISEFVNSLALLLPILLGRDISLSIQCFAVVAALKFAIVVLLVNGKASILTFRFNRALLKKQVAYSLPLAIASLASVLNLQVDKWFISQRFSQETFAIYFNGARELPFVGIISSSIMAVVVPDFVRLYSEGKYEQIISVWTSATKKATFLFIPLMCFLMLFSVSVVTFLFSAKYVQSAAFFSVYLFLLPLRVTIFGAVLSAAGKSRLILRASVQMLVLNFLLCYLLIDTLEIWAPMVSALVSTYYLALIQLYYSSRTLSVSIAQVFPWKYFFTVGLLSAISFLISKFIFIYVDGGALRLSIAIAVFFTVYRSAVYISGRHFKRQLFFDEMIFFREKLISLKARFI